MGFACSSLFIDQGVSHYLASNPARIERKEKAILNDLGLPDAVKIGTINYLQRIPRANNQIAISAYEAGAIVADSRLHQLLDSEALDEFIARVQIYTSFYPFCRALYWSTVDNVNLYHFALFENDQLERVQTGYQDRPVVLSRGAVLAEELKVNDVNDIAECGRSAFSTVDGARITAALTKRFLGAEFDEAGSPSIDLDLYEFD
jgi:hypothetical protein